MNKFVVACLFGKKVYQPNQEAPLSSSNKQISKQWSILMPDGSRATFSQPRALATAEISQIVD